MKKITAKLGTMRKPVDWVVYPKKPDDKNIIIQSDKRIAAIDSETGAGLLSASRSSGAYFIHLTPSLGAKPITVSPEILAEIKGAMPQSGDKIGPGVYVA